MIAALFFALCALLIVRLNSAFPGMMLYDYSRQIMGKVVAYALAVYFALYFLLVAVHLNIQLTDVLRVEFYPKTPHWAILMVTVLVTGSIAHRGVTNVGRFFELIGAVFVVTAVMTHVVMITQGSLQEILPLFRASQIPKYLAGTKDVEISFLGVELLLVFPLSGKKIRRSTAVAFLSVLFVGLFYVFVMESCIMMLGMESSKNYNFALIEAIKQIDNPILERFDMLYLTVGFSGLVAGLCGVYLALVEFVVRLFKKGHRPLIVACVGLLIVALCVTAEVLKAPQELFETALQISGLFSALLIPAILLLTAKVRGLVQKSK